MCFILFGLDCHPRYKLVLVANRDEFFLRPTQAAAFWAEDPSLLAGKDLLQGGTWMGITKTGLWAALTNYRDPLQNKCGAPSRGMLVYDYLTQGLDPVDYLERLAPASRQFPGFNLLAGTIDRLYYFSNQEMAVRQVQPGIHGLSNQLLDVSWPKVKQGTERLAEHLQEEDVRVDALFHMMADRIQAPDDQLPKTGVSLGWERLLSSIFIAGENYGTRSTTVLLIDRHNRIQFWEKTFPFGKQEVSELVYFDFIMKMNQKGQCSP